MGTKMTVRVHVFLECHRTRRSRLEWGTDQGEAKPFSKVEPVVTKGSIKRPAIGL